MFPLSADRGGEGAPVHGGPGADHRGVEGHTVRQGRRPGGQQTQLGFQ